MSASTSFGTCFVCGKRVPDASGMVACRGGCYQKAFGIEPLMVGMSRREFLEKRERDAKKLPKKKKTIVTKPKPVQTKKPIPAKPKTAPPKKVAFEEPEPEPEPESESESESESEHPVCWNCDDEIYGEQETACEKCGRVFCRSCFQTKNALKLIGCDVDDEYACIPCWEKLAPSKRYCTETDCKTCRNKAPNV